MIGPSTESASSTSDAAPGERCASFLSEAQSGEFWGADIDGASIDWLRADLCPPLHVCRSWAMPPLDLEPGSFDLIWAISVFTHLTDNSLAWLHELHRLLRPGGLLMATYMGRWNSEFLAAEPWDEDRVGMNVLQHYQDWSRGGPSVLMSDWWVQAHWGRAFEIVTRRAANTEPELGDDEKARRRADGR